MTGSPETPSPDRTGDSGADPGSAELFDFLSVYLEDRRGGTVRPLDEYQARFPGHEQAIASEYERLGQEEQAAAPPLRRIGPYEIRRLLGSGGQGMVLLAEDTRLRRQVALKVLGQQLGFVSTERLQRFRREAELLSQLDHPGICQVYEASTFDGAPFLAMRYVEGRTLAAILRDRRARGELPRTRADLHEAMRWIELAAHALHEAHEHGMVHRDIKPGNLMIDDHGQPVLLDFGLARLEDDRDGAITHTGNVLGTLAYMAPEVLARRRADRRADVYALGVTLYECLAHVPPFEGATNSALWRAIEGGHAVPVRDHNAAVPADLAAVLATAIAVDPAHRYATAAEFAADLARVRNRQPILARPQPLRVRMLRWAQRHPTLTTALLAAVALIIGLGTSLERVGANERAARALNRAIQGNSTDEAAALSLQELLDAAGSAPGADLRSALLQVLDSCHLAWQAPRTIVPADAVDPPPAFSADGSLVALGDSGGNVTVRRCSDGTVLARRRIGASPVTDTAFAGSGQLLVCSADFVERLDAGSLQQRAGAGLPDTGAVAMALLSGGQRFAVAMPGAVQIHDSDRLGLLDTIPLAPAMPIRRARLAPTGRYLAVLGRDRCADPHGCTHCWIVDLEQRQVVQSLRAADQDFTWVEWHPRGTALALAANGGHVEVRAVPDGRRLFEHDTPQEVNWCGFDPSGDLLLIPQDQGTDLWRWRDRSPYAWRRLPHPSERTIGAAGFSGDGQLFAAVLRDGLVLVYSTDDWRPLRSFKHRVRDTRYLAWLPQSGALMTGDLDHLSAWCAGVRPHAPELWGHDDAVASVAMHPDSRRVLTGSRDGTARLWSLDRAVPLHVFEHDGNGVRRVHFAAGGGRLLTVDLAGVARVFDTDTGERLALLRVERPSIVDAGFLDAGGAQAFTIGDDGRCITWDVATGALLRDLCAGGAPLRCAAVDPHRGWIATGGADRAVTVWDPARPEATPLRRFEPSDVADDWRINPLHQVRGLVFAADGSRLLASLVNNLLLDWHIDDDWRSTSMMLDSFGGPIAFDAQTGTAICADYSFGRLAMWRDGALLPLRIDGHSAHANRIAAVRVAREGGIALSAGHDGVLLVWNLRNGRVLHAIRAPGAILDADFSADGRWIVTGGADGAVKLWPRDPVAAARAYLAQRNRAR